MQDKNPNSPTLDKIDPSKGYVKGNVNVISQRASRLKSDGTAAEHRAIADYMDHMTAAKADTADTETPDDPICKFLEIDLALLQQRMIYDIAHMIDDLVYIDIDGHIISTADRSRGDVKRAFAALLEGWTRDIDETVRGM
jgi:hypothetical protein